MSGDTYYFGDNVHMQGGRNNTGMIKQSAPAGAGTASPALREAAADLHRLIPELREVLSSVNAQAVDDVLPDISVDGSTQPQERHRALMAVAGIAATVGTVGQPVLDAVNKLLELLGSQ